MTMQEVLVKTTSLETNFTYFFKYCLITSVTDQSIFKIPLITSKVCFYLLKVCSHLTTLYCSYVVVKFFFIILVLFNLESDFSGFISNAYFAELANKFIKLTGYPYPQAPATSAFLCATISVYCLVMRLGNGISLLMTNSIGNCDMLLFVFAPRKFLTTSVQKSKQRVEQLEDSSSSSHRYRMANSLPIAKMQMSRSQSHFEQTLIELKNESNFSSLNRTEKDRLALMVKFCRTYVYLLIVTHLVLLSSSKVVLFLSQGGKIQDVSLLYKDSKYATLEYEVFRYFIVESTKFLPIVVFWTLYDKKRYVRHIKQKLIEINNLMLECCYSGYNQNSNSHTISKCEFKLKLRNIDKQLLAAYFQLTTFQQDFKPVKKCCEMLLYHFVCYAVLIAIVVVVFVRSSMIEYEVAFSGLLYIYMLINSSFPFVSDYNSMCDKMLLKNLFAIVANADALNEMVNQYQDQFVQTSPTSSSTKFGFAGSEMQANSGFHQTGTFVDVESMRLTALNPYTLHLWRKKLTHMALLKDKVSIKIFSSELSYKLLLKVSTNTTKVAL